MRTIHTPTQAAPSAAARFAERGAAVPFTTPMLVAARVRAAAGGSIELIVPDPMTARGTGGRGDWVVPWGAVRDLCRPTLHDWRLHQAIAREVLNAEAGARAPSPALVRRCAIAVAAEGYAGRPARDAARRAVAAQDARERAIAAALPPEADDAARATLSALAAPFAPEGELAALSAALARLAARLDADASDEPALAEALSGLVRATLASADPLLARARAASSDPARLWRAWSAAPAAVEATLSAPEWWLDGWGPASAAQNLRRAAALAPMPAADAHAAHGERLRRALLALPDAGPSTDAGASAADRIARNERLRADALMEMCRSAA
jgi:hypothetical protein